jgi:hypothetical protein
MSKITPKFNKSFPKGASNFFDASSDDIFKREHPIAYGFLVFFGITALMLPIVTYLVITLVLFPAPNSPLLLLGLIGAFIIGVGLFNIVAAWIHQYLGHIVTILAFVVGFVLILISCQLLYVK